MKKVLVVLLGLISSLAYGQFGYNPNAVRPVLEDDVMFRKIVQRRINMNEKQNKGFAPQSQIPETDEFNFVLQLFKALQDNKLRVYEHSSSANIVRFKGGDNKTAIEIPIDPDTKLPYKQLTSNPDMKSAANYVNPESKEYGKYTEIACSQQDQNADGAYFVTLSFPTDDQIKTASIKITEEVIFDKRRSRMYINILAITIEFFCGGDFSKPRYYHFKYKEVDKYFREKYQETQTIGAWYNPQNLRRHMCVMDAFELRLFSSRIIKVSNPDDLSLAEVYKSPDGTITEELYKAQEAENELMEFEHNLWEF
ncbi:MAG: gliding motility protein GldN [Thermonemataceae bacterium]|nr:gliding motility protein GldN [Thermonemataceae bacterium]